MQLSTISWRRIKEIERFRIESELVSGKTIVTNEIYSLSKRDNDLVKVIFRSNLRVLHPQFNGPVGITFQADPPAVFLKVQQGKHLPGYFKDQCCFGKMKAFGDCWFGQAVFAYFFDVHIRNGSLQNFFNRNFEPLKFYAKMNYNFKIALISKGYPSLEHYIR